MVEGKALPRKAQEAYLDWLENQEVQDRNNFERVKERAREKFNIAFGELPDEVARVTETQAMVKKGDLVFEVETYHPNEGIFLVGTCPKCGLTARSGALREPKDLGHMLFQEFIPHYSHKCEPKHPAIHEHRRLNRVLQEANI